MPMHVHAVACVARGSHLMHTVMTHTHMVHVSVVHGAMVHARVVHGVVIHATVVHIPVIHAAVVHTSVIHVLMVRAVGHARVNSFRNVHLENNRNYQKNVLLIQSGFYLGPWDTLNIRETV